MNATDFFTKAMFLALKQDIKKQKIIDPSETTYGCKLTTNGNKYHLRICTGFLKVEPYNYYVSFWEDHNYTKNGHREQGGSCGSAPNMENWESFKTWINKKLSQFPDYTPEANEQLCWF